MSVFDATKPGLSQEELEKAEMKMKEIFNEYSDKVSSRGAYPDTKINSANICNGVIEALFKIQIMKKGV